MTEVEKLYSLAGVKPLCQIPDSYCGMKNVYEDFTAEKQIELIKCMLKNFDIDFSQIGQRIDTSLDGINCISGIGSADTFEDSLCMAVNDLWQDLTEEEQNEIREILE